MDETTYRAKAFEVDFLSARAQLALLKEQRRESFKEHVLAPLASIGEAQMGRTRAAEHECGATLDCGHACDSGWGGGHFRMGEAAERCDELGCRVLRPGGAAIGSEKTRASQRNVSIDRSDRVMSCRGSATSNGRIRPHGWRATGMLLAAVSLCVLWGGAKSCASYRCDPSRRGRTQHAMNAWKLRDVVTSVTVNITTVNPTQAHCVPCAVHCAPLAPKRCNAGDGGTCSFARRSRPRPDHG